jgi:hypothetical protein
MTGIEPKRRHYRRLERRLTAADTVNSLDLIQIDLLDHQLQNEPRQVILRHEISKSRSRNLLSRMNRM